MGRGGYDISTDRLGVVLGHGQDTESVKIEEVKKMMWESIATSRRNKKRLSEEQKNFESKFGKVLIMEPQAENTEAFPKPPSDGTCKGQIRRDREGYSTWCIKTKSRATETPFRSVPGFKTTRFMKCIIILPSPRM
ncbi:hypothetical protein CC80DRAFT_563938 [Byssothecium circinans]|uniref:Uncharacterized protein n=1 Tax=Byssothecium circinans TaxID=147558 RepID=A0A6A5TW97_9PLEO|nr:hypothetical protein CC80DRAFT_563938 [Byssothecium circinans]